MSDDKLAERNVLQADANNYLQARKESESMYGLRKYLWSIMGILGRYRYGLSDNSVGEPRLS